MARANLQTHGDSDQVEVDWHYTKVYDRGKEFDDVKIHVVVERDAHYVTRVKHEMNQCMMVNQVI